MKLTSPQRSALQELSSQPDGLHRSCTNRTLRGLERLGLVRLEWVKSPHDAKRLMERWRITDAGRHAIEPQRAPE
jgi:DNA-binding HxlR family transcriptional regulator